jgi:uncharacterized protein
LRTSSKSTLPSDPTLAFTTRRNPKPQPSPYAQPANPGEKTSVHGYDTKFAMHALRLGVQGVELLTTGRITLPVPEPDRIYLRRVRRGEVGLEEVIDRVDQAAEHLVALRDASDLPAEPDRGWVDGWLHRSHLSYWGD